MNIVFDLDGVLFEVQDYAEEHIVKNKDWKEYFSHTLEFPPIKPMIELLLCLMREGHSIYLITGRPESNRALTEESLRRHVGAVPFLIMRQNDDKRPTEEIKWDMFNSIEGHGRVNILFEDDPKVIDAMLEENRCDVVVQVHGFRYTRSDLVPFCFDKEEPS